MAEDLAQGHPVEPEEGARDLAEGWQPDPFDHYRFRWWDGGAWSAYVHDGRDTLWDPAPVTTDVERPPGLPGIGIAIAGYVVGVALSFFVRAVVDVSRPVELVLTSLALWTGLLGAVVIVSTTRGTGSLVRDVGLRFRWADLGYGFAGSIAARVIAGYAVSPVPVPRRRLGEPADRSILDDVTHQRSTWIVLILVVCVGAPIVEEIFFRGLLQSRLVGRYGPVVGIGVASVLFGAAHLIGWTGPLSLAFAWAVAAGGVILGAIYYYSGRLGTSILAHAFFNAQALLVLWLLR